MSANSYPATSGYLYVDGNDSGASNTLTISATQIYESDSDNCNYIGPNSTGTTPWTQPQPDGSGTVPWTQPQTWPTATPFTPGTGHVWPNTPIDQEPIEPILMPPVEIVKYVDEDGKVVRKTINGIEVPVVDEERIDEEMIDIEQPKEEPMRYIDLGDEDED